MRCPGLAHSLRGRLPLAHQADDSIERSSNHGKKEDQQRVLRAQPCSKHGEELHVAQTHSFASSHQPIEEADREDESRRCSRPKQGKAGGAESFRPASTRTDSGPEYAQEDAGQCEYIGQQQCLRIHDGETDSQEA